MSRVRNTRVEGPKSETVQIKIDCISTGHEYVPSTDELSRC